MAHEGWVVDKNNQNVSPRRTDSGKIRHDDQLTHKENAEPKSLKIDNERRRSGNYLLGIGVTAESLSFIYWISYKVCHL